MNINREIEYKYWAGDLAKKGFAKRIEEYCENNLQRVSDSKYVVSCDDYFLRKDNSFIRFRKGDSVLRGPHSFSGITTRFELTAKSKETGNTVRKEINLDVSNNDDSEIEEFLGMLGYEKKFQVYKEAWIWYIQDCIISYYTLSDGRSIIELEALDPSSIEDGISTIKKWEDILKLKDLEREKRSLYEIYMCEVV